MGENDNEMVIVNLKLCYLTDIKIGCEVVKVNSGFMNFGTFKLKPQKSSINKTTSIKLHFRILGSFFV